jgi:hypothetical protein
MTPPAAKRKKSSQRAARKGRAILFKADFVALVEAPDGGATAGDPPFV